jgi:predicted dehydrogenase
MEISKVRLVLIVVLTVIGAAALIEQTSNSQNQQTNRGMSEVKLITLDPGHFHAALVQKRMYPNVSKRVDIYAPLGFDLTDHLNRIARFNLRADNPTDWQLEVHTGPDFFERMLKDRLGNSVVISGRNQGKIERVKATVEAGLNVLVDKPWIIDPVDLSKLESALDIARQKGIVAYDIMTERYEITTMLQRELVNDSGVFGSIIASTEREPAVVMDGLHHLMKTVAGVPNLRPSWFFDVNQQGEGLADTGTHLVDLVQWMLFPEQAIDYRKDVKVIGAKRWPTSISKPQFQKVTGERDFPGFLSANLKNDQLDLYCNGSVSYTLRGVHVKVKVGWDYESAVAAGDTHFAAFRGSQSRIEVRQGREEKYRTELYVVPYPGKKTEVLAALRKRVQALQGTYPGLAVEDLGEQMRVTIPDKYRVGHEEHFAQVTDRFLEYVHNPAALPSWERVNMLSKYYVTTKAVELSRSE